MDEIIDKDDEEEVSDDDENGKNFWFLLHLFTFRIRLIARCEEVFIRREQLAAFLENLIKAMNYHGFEFKPVPETQGFQTFLKIYGEIRYPHSDNVMIFNRNYGKRPESPYDHPRLLLSHFLHKLAEMVLESVSVDDIKAYVGRCGDEHPWVEYTQLLGQIRFFDLLEEVTFREEMGARGTFVLMLMAATYRKSVFRTLNLRPFRGLDEVAEDPLKDDDAEANSSSGVGTADGYRDVEEDE